MTISPNQPVPFGPQKSAEAVQALHDDIRAKWNMLSDREVGALTDTDDLVAQIVRLYTLNLEEVQSDVAALLDGRSV